MKRNTKNLIFVVVIILMLGSMFLTNYYAKKSISNSGVGNNMMGNPPSMGNDNTDNTPPTKPDSDDNT